MILGIVLIVIQVFSFIPDLVLGQNIFNRTIPYLIGRFSFGIVGIILIVKANKKKQNNNSSDLKL